MVTNRVYKVLVTTGTEGSSLAALTAGQYIVVDESGTKISATTVLAPESKVQIVVAAADGSKVFSDLIRVKDVNKYNKEVYRARIAAVKTLTFTTPVAGYEYNVTIIDTSDKEILQHRQNKRSYTVIAATGETATTLDAKFIAKINADPASVVVASGTSTLILTAKAYSTTADAVGEYQEQYTFEVTANQYPNTVPKVLQYQAAGTVVNTTNADFGSGNGTQIIELEQRGLGYRGIDNRTKFPVLAIPIQATAAGTYDVYVLESENEYESNSETFGRVSSPISTIIAVNAGAGTATIEPILVNISNPLLAAAEAAVAP